MSVSSKHNRTAALASRAKTRAKVLGRRGVTDVTEDEILAMMRICDLVLNDYPGPLTRGEPDLSLNTNKQEIANEHAN